METNKQKSYVIVPLHRIHGNEERNEASKIREYVRQIDDTFISSYMSSSGYVLLCADPKGLTNGTRRAFAIINKYDDGRLFELRKYTNENITEVEEQLEHLCEVRDISARFATFIRGTSDRKVMQWKVKVDNDNTEHYLIYEESQLIIKMTPPETAREIIAATMRVTSTEGVGNAYTCIAADTTRGVYYATRLPKEGSKPFKPGAWRYGHLIIESGKRSYFLSPAKDVNGKVIIGGFSASRKEHTPISESLVLRCKMDNENVTSLQYLDSRQAELHTTYEPQYKAAVARFNLNRYKSYVYYASYIPSPPPETETLQPQKY